MDAASSPAFGQAFGQAVLSVGKLAPGQQRYYLDTVAAGAEEYYTGAREAPGQWLGSSAGRLGLAGVVDADALHRVLSHVDPRSDVRLTACRSVPKVVGFDATFCAPKSVSLLYALADPEASNGVRNAHDAAVAAALDLYEGLARGRRDHDGVRLVDGEGFVAAGFRHRTSRAGDPQLHTHVVMANLVYAPEDRRWSALDARPLYAWARPVGHLYEAQLRWELTRRLGVGWGPVVNGIADVAGIPDEAIRVFSTRRAEIQAHLAEHGQSGARAAQAAAYATRRPKDPNVDTAGLQPGWRARAAAVGLDDQALVAVLERSPRVDPVDVDALYRHLASPDGLTAHRSSFDRRHVIEAVCDRLPNGAPVAEVLALVDGFLASDLVIALGSCDGRLLRRGDGRLVPSGDDQLRWTTPEMVATERRLLAAAVTRRHDHAGVAHPDTVEAAIASRPTLSGEQAAMVRSICTSGAGVEVVEGVAGAGKTFALGAARDAWTASGYRVVGASLAARAAARLEDGSGIPSTSLDRLLGRLDHGYPLAPRDVAVVDEAAMVGTRKLLRLFDHAHRAGAKVVLIGDPRQLPEIDAGGAFSGLTSRLGASTLTDNRRQREPWERAALADLRAGRADQTARAYHAHGRVHTTGDVRAQLVNDWLAAYTNGDDAVILAATRGDVDDLNRRARHQLVVAGLRAGDAVLIDRQVFGVGDDVLALRNDYRLGVLNGTRLTIDRVDRRGRHFIARHEGQRLVVPFAYAADGNLALGYAMTIHKAQGATVDRAFVLASPTLPAEPAYTALSRATVRTDIYVDGDGAAPERPHVVPPIGIRRDQLEAGLHRSVAQRLALDQTGERRVALDALRAERDLLRQALADRPPDRHAELARLADQIRATRHSLQTALARRADARAHLARLGPITRVTHRHHRAHLEALERSADTDIVRCERNLSTQTARYRSLSVEQQRGEMWEIDHQPQLDRLTDLDRTISVRAAIEHPPEPPTPGRVIAPTIERGLGLSL
jgi:conjugative relaxase-like TrwC/TraI family protein